MEKAPGKGFTLVGLTSIHYPLPRGGYGATAAFRRNTRNDRAGPRQDACVREATVRSTAKPPRDRRASAVRGLRQVGLTPGHNFPVERFVPLLRIQASPIQNARLCRKRHNDGNPVIGQTEEITGRDFTRSTRETALKRITCLCGAFMPRLMETSTE